MWNFDTISKLCHLVLLLFELVYWFYLKVLSVILLWTKGSPHHQNLNQPVINLVKKYWYAFFIVIIDVYKMFSGIKPRKMLWDVLLGMETG